MYGDNLIKLLNIPVNSLESIVSEDNPPFQIPKKIVLTLSDYIGDVVLLTPLIRNLRYNFGEEVKIDLVGNASIQNLVETLPYYDNFYLKYREPKEKCAFLKNNNYDTFFLLNFSLRWALAAYQAGISQRVSFNLQRLGFNCLPVLNNLVTHLVKYTPINDKTPQLKVYLNIIDNLGLKIFDEHPEVRLLNEDIKKAESLIKDISGPKVLIQASSKSIGKEWGFENWVTILKYLKNKYNCNLIATGNSSERVIYDYLSAESGVEINNFCGKTTVREAIALCKHADLVITLDTAQAHLAALANSRNIIIIYGPTNEAQWKPYSAESNIQQIYMDLECRPCITRICTHRNCLNLLTSDMVIDSINKINL